MTDRGFSPAQFHTLCSRVRQEVAAATAKDMESANAWVDQAMPFEETIAEDPWKGGGKTGNRFFRSDGDSRDRGGDDTDLEEVTE